MSISPDTVQVGHCYLAQGQRFLQVTHVTADGRVRFKYRDHRASSMPETWWAGMLNLRDFAATALREIPCAREPETNK